MVAYDQLYALSLPRRKGALDTGGDGLNGNREARGACEGMRVGVTLSGRRAG